MPRFRPYKYPLQVQRQYAATRNIALRRYIRRRRIAKRVALERAIRPKFGVLARKISRYAY